MSHFWPNNAARKKTIKITVRDTSITRKDPRVFDIPSFSYPETNSSHVKHVGRFPLMDPNSQSHTNRLFMFN